MTTYLKSLASLPVLLVTGVWREAATRTGTRRLLAGVQGVIMAAGNMATEGRSDTVLWTVDTGHGQWSLHLWPRWSPTNIRTGKNIFDDC